MKMDHLERYNNWAATYNADVGARKYDGLGFITDFLVGLCKAQKLNFSQPISDLRVLDVGCGTGLLGEQLQKRGFSNLDGIDFSPKMLEEAQKTDYYKKLTQCDIRYALPKTFHNQYDLVISCGVFTLDMIMPESLAYLMQVTKVGGAIILGTRVKWYNTYDFEGFYKKMIRDGYLRLVDCRLDAPYLTGEFDAHYWAFEVLDNQIDLADGKG